MLIKVTELARIAAKAIGINRRETLSFKRWLKSSTTGKKNAAAAVLLIKELNVPTDTIVTSNNRLGWSRIYWTSRRLTMSTTPVRIKAAVIINKPSSRITVSLPNPAKALSTGTRPHRTTATSTPRAVTSGGTHSNVNRSKAITRMIRSKKIDDVIGVAVCLF